MSYVLNLRMSRVQVSVWGMCGIVCARMCVCAPLRLPWAILGRAVMGLLGSCGPGLDGQPNRSKVRFYGEPAEPFGHP